MLGEFWKAASGKLVDRWAELGSAVVFWAGLLGVWLWSHGGWATARQGSTWLDKQSSLGLFVLLLGVLLLAAAPAVVVARVTAPMLRLLEGYWPSPATWLWDRRVAKHQDRLTKDLAEFNRLEPVRENASETGGGSFSRADADKFARADWSLHHRPAREDRVMPTRVGNILRAAEDRPRDRYGLDSVIVWARLWVVLPDTAREELSAARSGLDSSVAAVTWGLLYAVTSPAAGLVGAPGFALLPAVVGVVVGVGAAVAAAVWWTPQRAVVFADLLDSAFDLYRFDLYEQVRWPPPTNPSVEHAAGESLTQYLWRGSEAAEPTFTHPNEKVSSDDEPGS